MSFMRIKICIIVFHFSSSIFSQQSILDVFEPSVTVNKVIKDQVIKGLSGQYEDKSIGQLNQIPIHKLLEYNRDDSSLLQIPFNITFINCSFPETLILEEMKFPSLLKFENCSFPQGVLLRNIEVETLNFSTNNGAIIQIEEADIKKLRISKDEMSDWISISGTTFHEEVNLVAKTNSLDIRNNTFKTPEPSIEVTHDNLFHTCSPTESVYIEVETDGLEVNGNNFLSGNPFDVVHLWVKESNGILIANNKVDGYFSLNGKSEFLDMYGNEFHKFDIKSFILPEFNSSIPWEDINGHKLSHSWGKGEPYEYIEQEQLEAFYDQMNFADDSESYMPEFYEAETEKELLSKWFFDKLVGDYYRIYQTYKVKGQIENANAIYVEMKELYGRRYKVLFRDDSNLTTFLTWKMNQLLKTYTEHGTQPIKAIVISIYIILFFGLIYFLFPSEWDSLEWKRKSFSRLTKKQRVSLVLIHLINSIVLSLNAFVTLGFGRIPTSGFPRYVCVIQGSIGWFLLSLFTVALINQTLF